MHNNMIHLYAFLENMRLLLYAICLMQIVVDMLFIDYYFLQKENV